MGDRLAGQKIAFLATDGVEQIELTEPWKAVKDEGARPVLVSIKSGSIQGFEHTDPGDEFPVDQVVGDADAGEFDGLVLPGGVHNPDALRVEEDAVAFVRAFADAGKPIGAICHGPWLLVEAGLADGHTLTSFPSLETDIVNAGGSWVDRSVVVDEGIVTSRTPDDLESFCSKLIEEFEEGVHPELASSV